MQSGNECGAEALVRDRFYWKNYPEETEVAEEFRLFWNLFHDKTRQILLHCDANGTEHTVVRIDGSRVEVQLKFLVDFLRAKQMHLALQWEVISGAIIHWPNSGLALGSKKAAVIFSVGGSA